MWKKLIYILLALFVAYFIYVIFFKTVAPPPGIEAMREKAKTKKVVYYLKDDAIIYADEQVGLPDDKEITFKNVIIDLLKKR